MAKAKTQMNDITFPDEFLEIINQCDEAVILLNSKKQIIFFNKPAEKLLNTKLASLYKKPLEAISFFDEQFKEQLKKSLKSINQKNPAITLNYSTILPESNFIILELSIKKIKSRKSNFHYICFLKDITRIEEKFLSKKMESICTLSSGIAFEFNRILQTILGCSELILLKTRKNSIKEKANIIEKMALKGKNLVKQLLIFSKKCEADVGAVDINLCVKNVIDIFYRIFFDKIKVTLDLNEVPLFKGDMFRIQQAILNIILNAKDAVADGGEIKVSTKVVAPPKLKKTKNLKYCLVLISDSGHGINPEHVDKIFDPFFTTKEKNFNAGLGLSVAYGIVKVHGGFFTVESEKDEGTNIGMYLPIYEPEQSSSAKSTHCYSGTESILLIEDEPTLAQLLEEVLKNCGYNVYLAFKPNTAIKVLKSHKSEIKLAVIDVYLPGTNGFKLFSKMKEIAPDLKAIFTSGYNIDEYMAQLKKLTSVKFISKPFKVNDLVRVIRKTLDK